VNATELVNGTLILKVVESDCDGGGEEVKVILLFPRMRFG
jgi:hypothetical protein